MVATGETIHLFGKMIKKTWFISLLFLISGCYTLFNQKTLDKEMWELEQDVPLSKMNLKYKPNLRGYYFCKEKEKENGAYIILLEGGYMFMPMDIQTLKKQSAEDIKNGKNYIRWGKYRISSDTIKIQYFVPYSVGLVPVIYSNLRFALIDYSGIFLNDTTFQLDFSRESSSENQYASVSKHTPPRIYKFIKTDTVYSSENWLREKLKEK
jgi:hypothetical protein